MIKKQIIKQITKFTITLVMAFSVFSCATTSSPINEADSSLTKEQIREIFHEASLNEQRIISNPQEDQKTVFYINENLFNQIYSKAIDGWPTDIYAKENGSKSYLNSNKVNTYSIGLTTWKTIPLTHEYVLLVSQNKSLMNDLHFAKIMRFTGNHFEQVIIEPQRWYIGSKTDQLNWEIQVDQSFAQKGELETNIRFEDSLYRLKAQLESFLNEGYSLTRFSTLELLSQAKSDRYKTYLSYFQPAFEAKRLFSYIHEGQGMTHTEIKAFINKQLLPTYSAFYNRYNTNQEFSGEVYFHETLNIYESLQQGGDSLLLELQNKALRNAIGQQLTKQQKYTVLSDDYSELTRAVNSEDMNLIKKTLQKTKDINEHYKNWSARHQATQEGNLEILRLLVENGADIKVRTDTKTPSSLLFLKIERTEQGIISKLLNI
ncbi:hypothetical protein ACLKMH_19650 [Psychromonas sp. KJ10-10]|uniref:hypothetical protein n=1 Tax=Psychromonas sp. KJ10-10 TaxID=3391823 RepID=UPI0039B5128F